jgi:hypothetical protein
MQNMTVRTFNVKFASQILFGIPNLSIGVGSGFLQGNVTKSLSSMMKFQYASQITGLISYTPSNSIIFSKSILLNTTTLINVPIWQFYGDVLLIGSSSMNVN